MDVTRELVLPAPPEEVWEALTDPERLKEWFANDVEWDGGQLGYRWDEGDGRRPRIGVADEPRRLGFRWRGPEGDETRVDFELEETEDGTLLTVIEGAGAGWAAALGLRALAFAAPTRRFLVEALAARDTATATELASELPVTRQAVSKHLAALGEAGLVESSRVGRETRYRLTPGALGDALAWMERVGTQWDRRLSALRRHLGGGSG